MNYELFDELKYILTYGIDLDQADDVNEIIEALKKHELTEDLISDIYDLVGIAYELGREEGETNAKNEF